MLITEDHPEELEFYEALKWLIGTFERKKITDMQIYGILQSFNHIDIESRN